MAARAGAAFDREKDAYLTGRRTAGVKDSRRDA